MYRLALHIGSSPELPALGAAGLLAGIAVLAAQLFYVRRARRDALEANAAKSQFLANMSHEIRTPLNGILGVAEILAGSGLTPDQQELVHTIQASATALMALVNDLLDFSTMEAGRLQLKRETFDLPRLMEGCARLFGGRARAKGLAFELAVDARVPRWVRGDPDRLRQVLTNLLSNAVKFTERGAVRLEAAPAADPSVPAVLFQVTDTGIGIDASKLGKIFNPFTQADGSSTRRHGGAGLGLAICRTLAMHMGGSVGVDSRPGRGSTFWFLAPLERAGAPAAAPQEELRFEAPERPGRVLVVDDNPVNQIVVVRAVHTLGHSAEVASGGEAAVEAAARGGFDAILMDCQMPGMDGYQAAQEIRRADPDVPIIAMTANAVEGDREKCLAAGMNDYLPKPVRIASLAGALKRAMNLRATPVSADATRLPASPRPPGPAIGR